MREFIAEIAEKHYKNIEYLMSKFREHRIIVIGDYLPTDVRSHSSSYFREAAEFLNKIELLPLYQLSDMKNTASNVLDLIFVNEINDIKLREDKSMIIIEQCQRDI